MSSVFKIFSSHDCDFYYDGEYQGHITGDNDRAFRFEVERKGTYRVRFVNSRYKTELRKILVIDVDEEQDVDLDFTEVNAIRIKEIENELRIEAEKRKAAEDAEKKRIAEEMRKAAEEAERKRIEAEKRKAAEEAREKERIQWRKVHPEGLAAVQRNGKYYFENEDHMEVVPPIYDKVLLFSEGFISAKRDGKWGYINTNGQEEIPFIYEYALSFYDGLAKVKKNGKWGYIDKKGNEVIPCEYDSVWGFYEGLARVESNGKWGFVDKAGKQITSCIYNQARDFSEGFAWVKRWQTWGFINKTGMAMSFYPEHIITDFSEGYAGIIQWRVARFIGSELGMTMASEDYEHLGQFIDGLAFVKRNGKYGYIDKSFKEVIPCIYDTAWNFNKGLAMVSLANKSYLIDRCGNEINGSLEEYYKNCVEGFNYDDFYRGCI